MKGVTLYLVNLRNGKWFLADEKKLVSQESEEERLCLSKYRIFNYNFPTPGGVGHSLMWPIQGRAAGTRSINLGQSVPGSVSLRGRRKTGREVEGERERKKRWGGGGASFSPSLSRPAYACKRGGSVLNRIWICPKQGKVARLSSLNMVCLKQGLKIEHDVLLRVGILDLFF